MLLVVAVVITQIRFDGEWADAALFVLVAAVAALLFALGMAVRGTGAAPKASQSVLLIAGLALAVLALLRFAELLEVDDVFSAGTLTWVLAAFGALALWPGVRKRSAFCAFAGAVALGAALIAAWQWLFEPDSYTPFRWLFLLLALTYVLVSLALRGTAFRHSELLVVAAGLAVIGILGEQALLLVLPFGEADPLPAFWEAVVVVAGCGLLAYAAADKSYGPAYVGGVVLALFAALAGLDRDTLLWWPVLLGGLGLAALAAGLRPRDELPPPPEAIPASDLPLAARSADETVIRVRDET